MYRHGLKKHPLYSRWCEIKKRCYNKNSIIYDYYGGRGIVLYGPWINDFKLFFDYMMSLPDALKEGYQIDRINSDGNYIPGNVRWSSRHVQNVNQRIRKDNKTGFKGVSIHGNKFRAIITVNKKSIRLGLFNTAIEAVKARDKYIIMNNLTEYKLQHNGQNNY